MLYKKLELILIAALTACAAEQGPAPQQPLAPAPASAEPQPSAPAQPPAPPAEPQAQRASVPPEDRQSADATTRALAERCHAEDSEACTQLGNAFLRKDGPRAVRYYQRACELGAVAGCYGWGWVLNGGSKEVPADWARAEELFVKACDSNHTAACTMLGLAHYWGERGKSMDRPRSAPYFKKACAAGDVDVACFNLAFLILDKHTPGDEGEALALFRRTCDVGYALGCFDAGVLTAEGGAAAAASARTLFERGCKLGDQGSCKRARETASTKAPRALRVPRSKPPTLEEWNAVGEVTVTGSSALGCETKMVREWLRVSCRGKNDSGGTPTTVELTVGEPTETFLYAAGGITSLVTPFVAGVRVEAAFSWTDKRRKLLVEWPHGAPKPAAMGVFQPL